MRCFWMLALVALTGCAVEDEYLAPPPPVSSCPPPANSCSGGYRPAMYSPPVPQTAEPPR